MDQSELLSLINANQLIIYKLVHLYARVEEDKKDMYQEILLQAFKTYPAFRAESKFSTWLYRLCLNTIFSMLRKNDKMDYGDISRYEDMVVTDNRSDDKERLYRAIYTLPETQKAIVSMHLDGFDNKEIAEFMGTSPNLVGVKLHRAKQQLANLLKDI